MFTIDPERWATMWAPASLLRCQAAVTLTSMACWNSSSGSSSMATLWPMPALLIRMSTVPKCSTVRPPGARGRRPRPRRPHGQRAGEVGDQVGQAVFAAGGHDHAGPGGVQDAGEAVTESGGGAGDDGDLPVEAERGEWIDGRHGRQGYAHRPGGPVP